jgi:hypothetical protein
MLLIQASGLLQKLDEAARKKRSKALYLIDRDFQKQAAFLEDQASLKAGFCTRRAGKSYGAATALFQKALDIPSCSVLYIALTRDSAKKIMWKDCIKVLNRKFKLNCAFNETTLTATLPNGSVIYLTGADAKPEEMEKLLGQKYARVVIDEGASWKQDLRKLVYGVLKPAVADYRGDIMLIGTPGNLTKGLFFDVTNGNEPGWSLHQWTTFDNPYMAEKWKAEIEELIAANPKVIETPWFKQMYLGQWFIDTNLLVYKFQEDRNLVKDLPKRKGEWRYILGVDLGYDPDPSAFVLCAYNEYDPHLYVVKSYKAQKMIISDVAERIKYMVKPLPHCKIVIDAGAQGKQIAEEMRQRYGLPLEAAEKHGKVGFIELMNSDLIMGNIKLLESETAEIVEEWAALVWDEDVALTKKQENPACSNHLADALLYAWRYAYNYVFEKFTEKPKPGTEEEVDEFWERESQQLERKKNQDPFDTGF